MVPPSFRETGNDVLIGGAGNDVLIGGNNAVRGGGRPAGRLPHRWCGQRCLRVPPGNHHDGVTVSTELGKSTNNVKQDFITDFTPGQDTIFIQNDNGDNNYAIAYYNSVTADATFMNSGAR
jgi:Ca2+-binding RTX toxin-like protein